MDQMRTLVICLGQFLLFAALVSGDTQSLSWITAPSSVAMKDTAVPLRLSEIPHLAAAVLGITPDEEIKWDGMVLKSFIFTQTDALIHFTIDGIGKEDITSKYSTDVQLGSSDSHDWNDVSAKVENSFYDSIVLSGDKIPPVNVAGISTSLVKVAAFVDELSRIYGLSPHLSPKHPSTSPDLVVFHIKSLPEVFSKFGRESAEAKEAIKLLNQAIDQMTKDLGITYHDRLMVQVLTVTPGLATVNRVRRAAASLGDSPVLRNSTDLNVADEFSDDYSAMFNIILWTSFAMALTVLAISCGMWNMDPGRDSIIYRMTSQRMKKDQ